MAAEAGAITEVSFQFYWMALKDINHRCRNDNDGDDGQLALMAATLKQ